MEPPLEGGVVDAQRHLGVLEAAGGLLDVLDEHRDEGRVPVVGDDGEVGVLVAARDEGEGVDGGEGGAERERERERVFFVVFERGE